MYLEIESGTENFIKFSLEFLGFFSAFEYFSGFFFYRFLVDFQICPETVDESFRSTESAGASLVNSAQTMLKTSHFIVKTIPNLILTFSKLFPPLLYSKFLLFPSLHFHCLSNLQNHSKTQNLQFLFQNPNCPFTIRSTMASSRAGSKRKGKAPMQEDSPPHYDHSGYPSREAFNCFSTRNINFGRIYNFSHLYFMNFNQIMRRLK